jgi:COMPASS component SPP1
LGSGAHKVSADNLSGIRFLDVEPAPNSSISLEVDHDNLWMKEDKAVTQNTDLRDQPISGYTASEKEMAVLGLAALDGVQEEDAEDEDEESAIKSEVQGASDLTAVPRPKPVKRPHKVPAAKPSEGSSDKRFLCYICIKLFTRRRSVRDHIKKIHNDTKFDVARAIEVTVDPETGESIIPLAELVKTLPSTSSGHQAQQSVSRSASRASSVESNHFSTPAPVAGKKRSAAEMGPAHTTASKKKGTAKPKPLNTNIKKVKSEIDSSTEGASAFRSPSGTPVSSRASKPPVALKMKKQPSMSLASSPVPSDRMSLAPATDDEAEDEGQKAYLPAGEADENSPDNEPDNDNEVFCICRKGDNHTWMIACDGGCEDWFHGKCVNIEERDGDLIDKYICPNCEAKGGGQTTWKRMCRRKECRKPARVLADPPSKYCTDECKMRFWVGMVKRSDPNAIVSEDGLMIIGTTANQKSQQPKKPKPKKAKDDEEYKATTNEDETDYPERKLSPSRKKKNPTISPTTVTKRRQNDYVNEDANSSNNDDDDDNDPPLPTRGGALTIGDIKMLLEQAKTVEEIRQLGQKPPTPPYTSDAEAEAEAEAGGALPANIPAQPINKFPYNAEELRQLSHLSSRKRQLTAQLQLLADQEKFLAMVKTRSMAVVEALELGPGGKAKKKGTTTTTNAATNNGSGGSSNNSKKNICGFDARLSWSAAEFEEWRATEQGVRALERGWLDAEDGYDGANDDDDDDDGADDDGDAEVDGEGSGDDGSQQKKQRQQQQNHHHHQRSKGVCIRNKCPRHREWRRLVASEHKFEEEGVRRLMRKVEAEGREVRERAAERVLGGG